MKWATLRKQFNVCPIVIVQVINPIIISLLPLGGTIKERESSQTEENGVEPKPLQPDWCSQGLPDILWIFYLHLAKSQLSVLCLLKETIEQTWLPFTFLNSCTTRACLSCHFISVSHSRTYDPVIKLPRNLSSPQWWYLHMLLRKVTRERRRNP